MKYISKGEWFKKGTEAKLIDDYRSDKSCVIELNAGLFEGLRVCENPEAESRKKDEEYLDEEICSFDEFEVL